MKALLIISGILLTFTGIGALIGIPLLIIGLKIKSFNKFERDRREAIKFARVILNKKHKYAIIDTKTTGLGKTDEIIEITVIDMDQNILFNSKIKPSKRKRIPKEASKVHGIKMKDLIDCPTYADVSKKLKKSLAGKTLLAYNAPFDARLIEQTYAAAKTLFNKPFLPKFIIDVMKPFAAYIGEWNDYHNDYRWQKLERYSTQADHSALGDCKATLEIIKRMANDDY